MSWSNPIESFSNTLQLLSQSKPPGVSGSKIRQITDLAVKNVQSESVIIQKLYTHFKKTPASHKLGALYAVDAVVRAYYDEAKKSGQTIDPSAPDGTYASGVNRVRDLIESIIADMFASSPPSDHREKIKKLLDIWDRADTFPKDVTKSLRDKYFSANNSTTPPMSPPSYLLNVKKTKESPSSNPAAVNAPDTASILQALANIAKQKPNESTSATSNNLVDILKTGSMSQTTPPIAQSSGTFHGRRERSRSPSRQSNDNDNDNSRRRSRSPRSRPFQSTPPENYQRELSRDPTLPPGTIKTHSRTLFIGGIPPRMTESELRDIFTPFANIQSVVFHKERRHGFVKVYTRKSALAAKSAFDDMNRNGQTALRARWGVGFGPRDCCDYQKGVSIIPIARLTEADKRWIVNAEYGGTGGEPLVEGLSMEEPDIEIGAGVSSKAISRRMPTNGSVNGPRSTRDAENGPEHNQGQFPATSSGTFPMNNGFPDATPEQLQAFMAHMQQQQQQFGYGNQYGNNGQSANGMPSNNGVSSNGMPFPFPQMPGYYPQQGQQ